MKWLTGSPDSDQHGLYLMVLDVRAVRRRYAVAGQDYAGEPVAVLWLGSFGRDTLRQTRIDADLVVKHMTVKPCG